MTIMLILLGAASTLLTAGFGTRARESRRTDALTSAQAALDSMSREIANSGYGLEDNGIVSTDSGLQRLHFRANIQNNEAGTAADPLATNDPNEDITYYFDNTTQSILRYDPNEATTTTIIVNRISNVNFAYFNYAGSSSTVTPVTTPNGGTGRVTITVTVELEPVQGQPVNQTVKLTSDVNLRNSIYMRHQY